MRALENDLIIFFQLADLVGQLSESISHEAIKRCLFGLSNKTSKLTRSAHTFCNDFKSNLPREQAAELDQLLKEQHAIDAFHLLLGFLQLAPEERDQMRCILKAVIDHKTITIEDGHEANAQ